MKRLPLPVERAFAYAFDSKLKSDKKAQIRDYHYEIWSHLSDLVGDASDDLTQDNHGLIAADLVYLLDAASKGRSVRETPYTNLAALGLNEKDTGSRELYKYDLEKVMSHPALVSMCQHILFFNTTNPYIRSLLSTEFPAMCAVFTLSRVATNASEYPYLATMNAEPIQLDEQVVARGIVMTLIILRNVLSGSSNLSYEQIDAVEYALAKVNEQLDGKGDTYPECKKELEQLKVDFEKLSKLRPSWIDYLLECKPSWLDRFAIKIPGRREGIALFVWLCCYYEALSDTPSTSNTWYSLLKGCRGVLQMLCFGYLTTSTVYHVASAASPEQSTFLERKSEERFSRDNRLRGDYNTIYWKYWWEDKEKRYNDFCEVFRS